jgi:hypothetical protein
MIQVAGLGEEASLHPGVLTASPFLVSLRSGGTLQGLGFS